MSGKTTRGLRGLELELEPIRSALRGIRSSSWPYAYILRAQEALEGVSPAARGAALALINQNRQNIGLVALPNL